MNDSMCLEGGFWPAITGLLVAALAGGCNPGESLVTLTTATVTTEDETTASSNATTTASTATDSTESDATDSQTTTTVDTQTTSESDTTDPVPFCGDGVINNGRVETCEPPNQGGCRRDCTKCGDGELQIDYEMCDDGEENGMYGLNEEGRARCLEDCTGFAPYCGDHKTDDKWDEGCDGDNECSAECKWNSRLVFVTSVKLAGDMSTDDANDQEPGGVGLEKADNWCNQLAKGKGFSGAFKAWLSADGDGEDAMGRFDQTNAMQVPYENVKGERVVNSWSEFISGCTEECLISAVQYDENGATVADLAWTSTDTSGNLYPINNCLQWKSNDHQVYASKGDPASTSEDWVISVVPVEDGTQCNTTARLYCIQDGPPS